MKEMVGALFSMKNDRVMDWWERAYEKFEYDKMFAEFRRQHPDISPLEAAKRTKEVLLEKMAASGDPFPG